MKQETLFLGPSEEGCDLLTYDNTPFLLLREIFEIATGLRGACVGAVMY